WWCLLGPDPAVVHVPGGRGDAVLLRQPEHPGRDLAPDVRPRAAALRDPGRAGGLPGLQRQPAHALLVRARARSDRTRLRVRVPAAGPPAGRPARRRPGDPGRGLAALRVLSAPRFRAPPPPLPRPRSAP